MNLSLAENLVRAALKEAKRCTLPPLAVVILDAGGNLRHAVVQDGAGPLRFAIAQAKAYAAIGMGMSSGDLYNLFEQGVLPDRFSAAISAASNGKFAPQPGGELILRSGHQIGAIGISGASSTEDETVAQTAREVVSTSDIL